MEVDLSRLASVRTSAGSFAERSPRAGRYLTSRNSADATAASDPRQYPAVVEELVQGVTCDVG